MADNDVRNNTLVDKVLFLLKKNNPILEIDFDLEIQTSDSGVKYLNYKKKKSPQSDTDSVKIPLFPWRINRSIVELKNLVSNEVIKDVCMLRFCCISADLDIGPILYQEIDLCEFLTGDEISSVYAVGNLETTLNIILKLNTGKVCSIEITSNLPNDEFIQNKHEIIGRRGVACDQVVDSQVKAYSLYFINNRNNEIYTDSDFELFGTNSNDVDLIRSVCWTIRNPKEHFFLMDRNKHLAIVIEMIHRSLKENKKITL